MTDPQNPGGYPPQQPGPAQPVPGQPQPGYPQAGPTGYPGTAGGPPPGYGAPAQPPKKKRTGLIIGLAVGIPLVLIALIVLAVVLLIGSATGPADATNDFLKALENDDPAALQAVSCQALVDNGQLESLQTQLDQLETTRGTISSYNISSSSYENNTGEASGTVTYSKGLTTDIKSEVVKENGKWKVCDIQETSN